MIKIFTYKDFNNMSILEIIIYGLLGAIVLGMLFKWFIYDIFIKPKRKQKEKKKEKIKTENEDE